MHPDYLDQLLMRTLPQPDMRPILAKSGMTRHEVRDGLPLPNGYVSARDIARWRASLRRRARVSS